LKLALPASEANLLNKKIQYMRAIADAEMYANALKAKLTRRRNSLSSVLRVKLLPVADISERAFTTLPILLMQQ